MVYFNWWANQKGPFNYLWAHFEKPVKWWICDESHFQSKSCNKCESIPNESMWTRAYHFLLGLTRICHFFLTFWSLIEKLHGLIRDSSRIHRGLIPHRSSLITKYHTENWSSFTNSALSNTYILRISPKMTREIHISLCYDSTHRNNEISLCFWISVNIYTSNSFAHEQIWIIWIITNLYHAQVVLYPNENNLTAPSRSLTGKSLNDQDQCRTQSL